MHHVHAVHEHLGHDPLLSRSTRPQARDEQHAHAHAHAHKMKAAHAQKNVLLVRDRFTTNLSHISRLKSSWAAMLLKVGLRSGC